MKYTSIKEIQSILKEQNIYEYSVDGVCGQRTFESIVKAIEGGQFKLDFDFDKFRKLFNLTKITQATVDNINHLFNEFNKYALSKDAKLSQAGNPLMIAYMLATTWHETKFTFKPIKEEGSNRYLSKYDTGRLAKALGNTLVADGDGILYAGRGYVMITGRRNYDLFTRLLGVNLIDNPNLALKPEIASAILIIGSLKGLFTTRGLTDFIKYGSLEEFKEARRVINGTDANTMIASYAKKFVECIKLTKI